MSAVANPDLADEVVSRGRTLLAAGRIKKMVSVLADAHLHYPKDNFITCDLAAGYRMLERNEEALLLLLDAFHYVTDSDEAEDDQLLFKRQRLHGTLHYQIGLTYNQWQKYPEAVTAFQLAVNGSPNDLRRQAELAGALVCAGKAEESWQLIEKISKANPDEKAGIRAVAKWNRVQGYHQESAAILGEMLKKDPKDASTLTDMGTTYILLGKLMIAQHALTTANQWRPGNYAIGKGLDTIDEMLYSDRKNAGVHKKRFASLNL